MKILEQFTIFRAEPGTKRAVATFPSITVLDDGSLLAAYRAGPTKESIGDATEVRRSTDGGRTWSEPWVPFSNDHAGVHGGLQCLYITRIAAGHLIACGCWVNREAFPGKSVFNPETEGCLPMEILVADSFDQGRTFSTWRQVAMTPDVGPASLTSPILKLASGRLAISVESNKTYLDSSKWFQKVVYVYSQDEGKTWTKPVVVCQDPTGTTFYWDQRTVVAPDGRLVAFSWIYQKEENRYLNMRRHLSRDEGATYTTGEDLGITDQPGHPAILPDGRIVLPWVDRYGTQSIRARAAASIDAPFASGSEVVIYEAARPATSTRNTGDMLSDQVKWNYGLPFAETLPNGEVLVAYYAAAGEGMDIRCARLSL